MATNDVTGDELRSKAVTDSYRENFDRILAHHVLNIQAKIRTKAKTKKTAKPIEMLA